MTEVNIKYTFDSHVSICHDISKLSTTCSSVWVVMQ